MNLKSIPAKLVCLIELKVQEFKDRKDMEFTLVGESEANLARGKLAASTPAGKALMGRKKGETVEVNAPAGLIKFQILDISFSSR